MRPPGLPARVSWHDLPPRVTIWEVGARDGLQNESTVLRTQTKIELIERLAGCGLPVIEATSFVRPDRIPQLSDAANVMTGLHRLPGVRYPVLVPNSRGLRDAVAVGVDEIAVFVSATDAFARRNLGRPMASQMEMVRPVIDGARSLGLGVRGYVSMCFGDPWEGVVEPAQVADVCADMMTAGCTGLSLGDTIGVGTPGQVRALIDLIVARGIALDVVGVHFHDTYGQALANTLAALISGVTTIDSSAGGLGGCPYAESATGNLATEDLVWMLDGLGIETGVDLATLVDTSAWVAGELGRTPTSRVVLALARSVRSPRRSPASFAHLKNPIEETGVSEVFVVESLRTPFGSFGGALADVEAPRLGATVIQALMKKSGLAPASVSEVIVGEVLAGGVGQAPARQAMRHAGLPDSIHALTINKVCGSGLKAIMLGAGSIRLGDSDLVIAGGMENMSLAPYILKRARTGYRMGNGELIDLMVYDGLTDPYTGRHMGEIADAAAARHGLNREAQDEYAARSFQRAQKAAKEGWFKDEIVPVVKKTKKGDEAVVEDEGPFKVDFEKIKQLRPAFTKDGTVTAGNASSISDGAAMTLLASESALKKYNLKPKARLVAYSTNSLSPDLFPDAPVGAIEAACARAGIKVTDVDLFEVNEAFSVVAMIAIKELKLDPEKVNVNGGAVSLGHPIGASGGRLAATLVRELGRRQVRYGLATLCIGGGEAVAVVFERVN